MLGLLLATASDPGSERCLTPVSAFPLEMAGGEMPSSLQEEVPVFSLVVVFFFNTMGFSFLCP